MKKILKKINKKWPDYILEILVIIIGILLAFSLNNWNENRIERKEKRNYIVSLLDNLNSDKLSLEKQTQNAKNWALSMDTLIDMLLRPKNFSERQFLIHAHSAIKTPSFNYMSSTFDNLNRTGKLNILNDKELINKLFVYYNQISFYQKREDFALSFSRNQLIPLLNKLDNLFMIDRLSDSEIELLSAREDNNLLRQDLTMLSNDPELLNSLINKRNVLRVQKSNLEQLYLLNIELIDEIEGILQQ